MASRLYAAMISAATPMVPKGMMPLWNHAAGPKTVFFWAPGKTRLNLSTERVQYANFSSHFSIQMGKRKVKNIFQGHTRLCNLLFTTLHLVFLNLGLKEIIRLLPRKNFV